MKKSKVYYLVTITVILLFLSCKKNNGSITSNFNIDSKQLDLKTNCLENRTVKSIVHSCGGGCAVSYTEKRVLVLDSFIKVKYDGVSYIDEEIEEEYKGVLYIKCNNHNKASNVFFEGDEKENMLDVTVNSISTSFQIYSDELCSCINNSNKIGIEQQVKKKCHEINDEENYIFTDVCEYEKMADFTYLYAQIVKEYDNELLDNLPLRDTLYSTESIPEIQYLVKKDTIKIINTSEGGETIFKIYKKEDNGIIETEKIPY
jgi:hypothetical protein